MMSDAAQRRRPGRPRAGSEDKRIRIINEASTLFNEHGFIAVSLGDVAAAADISKAGLLHHFRSKSDLLAAVLEKRDVTVGESVNMSSARNIREALEVWIAIAQANSGALSGVALYSSLTVTAVRGDNFASQWLAHHLDDARQYLEMAFERGKLMGEVDPAAPSADLAAALVAVADGLQVQWLVDEDRHTSVTSMDAPMRVMIDAIVGQWLLDSAMSEEDDRATA